MSFPVPSSTIVLNVAGDIAYSPTEAFKAFGVPTTKPWLRPSRSRRGSIPANMLLSRPAAIPQKRNTAEVEDRGRRPRPTWTTPPGDAPENLFLLSTNDRPRTAKSARAHTVKTRRRSVKLAGTRVSGARCTCNCHCGGEMVPPVSYDRYRVANIYPALAGLCAVILLIILEELQLF